MNSTNPVLLTRRKYPRPARSSSAPGPASDESHEARAERSLARLEAKLEFRRRARAGLQLLGLVALPLLLSALLVRQARLSMP